MFLNKIDIRDIVRDHVTSLRDYGAQRGSVGDLVLFFVLPVGLASFGWWKRVCVPTGALGGLLSAYSIFMGLLPSLLVMVVAVLGTTKGDPATEPSLRGRKLLLKELTANLSFSILLSLVLVTTAMVALIVKKDDAAPAGPAISAVLIAGSSAFVVNLLMILRRIYALVVNEIERHRFNNNRAA